jgi:hypothetical protein
MSCAVCADGPAYVVREVPSDYESGNDYPLPFTD